MFFLNFLSVFMKTQQSSIKVSSMTSDVDFIIYQVFCARTTHRNFRKVYATVLVEKLRLNNILFDILTLLTVLLLEYKLQLGKNVVWMTYLLSLASSQFALGGEFFFSNLSYSWGKVLFE